MKGLILMAEFCRQPLDPGFSGVPHGFWTIPVSRGAAMLLGWLHSHTDAYLEKLTCNVARRALRTSSIKSWLEELEKAGFVKVYWPASKGDRITVALLAEPWENLFGPRRNRRAETGSPTAPKPAREGEQGEDQEKNNPCPPSADVSVDERFAKFWEHYPRKVGKPGAKVAFRAMLKKGHLTQARKGLMNWNGYWQTAQTPVSMIPHPATWLRDERYDNDPPAIPGWGAPAANGSGKHRDAGKVVYDGANNRFEIQDDGSRVLLATSDEVNAEFAATDWIDVS